MKDLRDANVQIEAELDDASNQNLALKDKVKVKTVETNRITIDFEASLEDRQKLQNEIYNMQMDL